MPPSPEIFESWVSTAFDDLKKEVQLGKSIDDAFASLRDKHESNFGGMPELKLGLIAAAEEARRRLEERQEKVSYLSRTVLKYGKVKWYLSPSDKPDSVWVRHKAWLKQCGRSEEEIRDVDEESTVVVSHLGQPTKAEKTYGLVVGHVQSGKTGNMAAVISKAADTPYKFFLVLSGMTDSLRLQTQNRLDESIVQMIPKRWKWWTEANPLAPGGGDFRAPTGGMSFDTRKQIAVIKKNGGILRQFLAALKNTPEHIRKSTPFLIIDDECDQASVNSAKLEAAMTRINAYIREILSLLPCATYVGYTATPFANVLINPQAEGDLYPRHFIHALRRPAAYFGAERLFGRAAFDGDLDEGEIQGLEMIREVPVAEMPSLRPEGRKSKAFKFSVTPSLEDAIRYFIMVSAARVVRGQGQAHSTMLVHTSVLNSVHQSTAAAITPYLQGLVDRLKKGDSELLNQMERIWTEEQNRVMPEQLQRIPVSFSQLAPHLREVAASIDVKVENWSSTSRIDYQQPGRRYLVIGGNVLARGLTLEGLSVSYFLRSSSQYDTLMQMGRWFGYRPGFEDLPRIWMTNDVENDFFDLALVEEQIRGEIRRYAKEDATPEDFGVKIRKIPGMAITAPAKMRHAQLVEIGFSGSHQQTTRFKRHDEDWLVRNWNAGAALIAHAGTAEVVRNNKVFRSVPVEEVRKFLRSYRVHESHKAIQPELILKYLENASPGSGLEVWNVVVVGTADGRPSDSPLDRLGRVPTLKRSAMGGAEHDACVKALMSRRDLLADIEGDIEAQTGTWDDGKAVRREQELPPLLLLYPIDRKSAPTMSVKKTKDDERQSLNAKHDVLGLGLVFPGDSRREQHYVSVRIEPAEAESMDGLDNTDNLPDSLLSDTVTDPALGA